MKPHIYKLLGLWRCGLRSSSYSKTGLGYTPLQAYEDWLAWREATV